MILGYARTSTVEQVAGLEAQIKELLDAGCERVMKEQVSSVKERAQLETALGFLEKGDTFVVTKADRLARSTRELLRIVERLETNGIQLRILNLGIDMTTPTGKLLLTTLGAMGQFEREIMLERQREGIERAKKQGKYKGRDPIPKEICDEVLSLCETRLTRKAVAKKMAIGVATVYRILKSRKKA